MCFIYRSVEKDMFFDKKYYCLRIHKNSIVKWQDFLPTPTLNQEHKKYLGVKNVKTNFVILFKILSLFTHNPPRR